MPRPRVLVAMTGASGVIHGVRLVQRLAQEAVPQDVILSEAAVKVLGLEHGLGGDPVGWLEQGASADIQVFSNADIAAPPASGSRAPRAMIVVPCSMGTVGRLAAGISSTLIERCADVALKERRPLVLVPRETPLSTLHLRNLLTLSEVGARIVPAMPAFYTRPKNLEDVISFVVDRAIQSADLDLPLRQVWRGQGS
jgi:4-hydroxy-3-polyprenylbenzoate decarboxylase